MENLKNMTDEYLLSRLNTSDDTSAYIEIYNRYHAQLYVAAYKRCSSTEVAEEIVQDLFINLWKSKGTINIHSSLSGYLFTAIRNLILNNVHKDDIRKKYNLSFGVSMTEYDNSTEENVIANDLNYHIDSKLAMLPQKCRLVFELSRKQYKSNKQIAFELGISEKTVENHITYAIKSLRMSLRHIFS